MRERLDTLRDVNPQGYQLRVIKRVRKPRPEVGDVFVLSPCENVYFYGKVLKADIERINDNSFLEGASTVFVFKLKSREPSLDRWPAADHDNLLTEPFVVYRGYWIQGLFYTVGNEGIDGH